MYSSIWYVNEKLTLLILRERSICTMDQKTSYKWCIFKPLLGNLNTLLWNTYIFKLFNLPKIFFYYRSCNLSNYYYRKFVNSFVSTNIHVVNFQMYDWSNVIFKIYFPFKDEPYIKIFIILVPQNIIQSFLSNKSLIDLLKVLDLFYYKEQLLNCKWILLKIEKFFLDIFK